MQSTFLLKSFEAEIGDFPTEVLAHILSFLPAPAKDLLRVRSVCRRFNEAARIAARDMTTLEQIASYYAPHLMAHFKTVDNYHTDYLIEALVRSNPQNWERNLYGPVPAPENEDDIFRQASRERLIELLKSSILHDILTATESEPSFLRQAQIIANKEKARKIFWENKLEYNHGETIRKAGTLLILLLLAEGCVKIINLYFNSSFTLLGIEIKVLAVLVAVLMALFPAHHFYRMKQENNGVHTYMVEFDPTIQRILTVKSSISNSQVHFDVRSLYPSFFYHANEKVRQLKQEQANTTTHKKDSRPS